LIERRRKGLGNIPAAEPAKPAKGVGTCEREGAAAEDMGCSGLGGVAGAILAAAAAAVLASRRNIVA